MKREARIMMTLQHQNSPCLLGISRSSSPKLLVLNCCSVNDKSFTIRTALHSKSLQLSQKEWCSISLQLAQAISYVHSKGFIHQDIISDNVLVSYWNNGYHAILIDFGKCIRSVSASVKQL